MDKKIVLRLAGLVVLLWLGLGLFPLCLGADRGTFGDMFGAVNSLFSGLAFAGVIYAIALQSQELSLQRAELKLTRTELHKSAEAQTASAQALTRQFRVALLSARLSAYSSLLQSANDRINNERLRLANLSESSRKMDRGTRIAKLEEERQAYEASLKAVLVEMEEAGM